MKKKLIIIAAGFLLSYPAAVLSNSINLSTNTFEDKIQKNIGEKNPQNIINNADIKYKNKDYKSAIVEYSKILIDNPKNKHALFRRALSKSKIKDYEGAISDYSKVIEIYKTYYLAFYNRGYVN